MAAAVKAVNVNTGVERSITANAEGLYLLNDLNPGTYRVTVQVPGFTSLQQENIFIMTNNVQRVNVALKVGAIGEEVTVSGAPPMLQADTAQTDYNISSEQVQELPTTSTTGRNFQSLYRLVPGSTPPAEQNSAGGNPQRAQAVNVNGVSNATNTTRIDGSVDAYPWLPYLVAYLPPTDGIESVNVVTGNFNAEQGAAEAPRSMSRFGVAPTNFMAARGSTTRRSVQRAGLVKSHRDPAEEYLQRNRRIDRRPGLQGQALLLLRLQPRDRRQSH